MTYFTGTPKRAIELALEPRRELGADGLDEHDAVGRHHERRDVIVAARVVDVARQLADLAALVDRRLPQRTAAAPLP